MTKHPPKLEEGRFAAAAGKPVSRTQICAHASCRKAVGQAAIFVNDPNGPSGWFHIECYPQARMGHVSVEERARIADVESVRGYEDCQGELLLPRKEVCFRHGSRSVGEPGARSSNRGEGGL